MKLRGKLILLAALLGIISLTGCVQIGGEPEEIASGVERVTFYAGGRTALVINGSEEPPALSIGGERYGDLEIRITTSHPVSSHPIVYILRNDERFTQEGTHKISDSEYLASGKKFGFYGGGEFIAVVALADSDLPPDQEVEVTAEWRVRLRGLDADLAVYSIAVGVLLLMFLLSLSNAFVRFTFNSMPRFFSRAIIGLSAIGLLILIFDELGLALQEWGVTIDALLIFRGLMALPGVSYALFTMNMILLLAGMWETFEVFDRLGNSYHAPKEKIRKMKIKLILFIFNLNLLVMGVQVLIYNGHFFSMVNQVANLVLTPEAMLAGGSILATLAVFVFIGRSANALSNELKDFVTRNNLSKLVMRAIFLGTFIVLSETMITKAALLLILIPRVASGIKKMVSRLLRIKSLRSGGQQGVDIRSVIDLEDRGYFYKLGFYWLIGSSLVIFLLFQFACSPFPPLAGPFPMSSTISLLYTLDLMVLILALLVKGIAQKLLVTAGICLQVFVRYLFPIFYPESALPPPLPPGDSVVSIFTGLGLSMEETSLFFVVLHLLIVAGLWYTAKATEASEAYMLEKTGSRLKSYALLTIGVGYGTAIVMANFIMAFLFILARNILADDGIIEYIAPLYLVVIAAVALYQLLVLSALPAIKHVTDSVKRAEGDAAVERYGYEFRWLRRFGWPGRTKVTKFDWIYLPVFVAFWLAVGIVVAIMCA